MLFVSAQRHEVSNTGGDRSVGVLLGRNKPVQAHGQVAAEEGHRPDECRVGQMRDPPGGGRSQDHVPENKETAPRGAQSAPASC